MGLRVDDCVPSPKFQVIFKGASPVEELKNPTLMGSLQRFGVELLKPAFTGELTFIYCCLEATLVHPKELVTLENTLNLPPKVYA